MSLSKFDVIVIGGGPAGYVAAIRCAQLGLEVACIDEWENDRGQSSLGGTCLNVGCIPSKALLDSSHLYAQISGQAKEHGIDCEKTGVNVPRMHQRKNKIVTMLTRGIDALFKKNGVKRVHGHAVLRQLGPPHDVAVVREGEEQRLSAKNLIIATGSRPVELRAAAFDGANIVDSSGALNFQDVPGRLGIIGAGVIGLELGSVWRRLGSEVVILEAMEEFLASADRPIAAEALKVFRKQGLDIRLGCRLDSAQIQDEGVSLSYTHSSGSDELRVDKLVVAVGRRPCTDGLGVAEAGLKLDERGRIEVNGACETSVPSVYAIGDVVRGPMLAHKASEEGVAVAERIAGRTGHVPAVIPWVIYTWPEIAWVGRTEEELKQAGVDYRCGEFPFAASGRARAMGETSGRIRVLADARTDRVLGVHCFGPQASELISEAVTVMAFEGAAEDIAQIVHAHPSLSEGLHEAALAVSGRSINI